MPKTARGFVPVKISVAVAPEQKQLLDEMSRVTGQTLSAIGSIALAIGLTSLKNSLLGLSKEMQETIARAMTEQAMKEMPSEDNMAAVLELADTVDDPKK